MISDSYLTLCAPFRMEDTFFFIALRISCQWFTCLHMVYTPGYTHIHSVSNRGILE